MFLFLMCLLSCNLSFSQKRNYYATETDTFVCWQPEVRLNFDMYTGKYDEDFAFQDNENHRSTLPYKLDSSGQCNLI